MTQPFLKILNGTLFLGYPIELLGDEGGGDSTPYLESSIGYKLRYILYITIELNIYFIHLAVILMG